MAWTAVVVDVDRPHELERALRRGLVPEPNWTVTRKDSGNKHAVWCLARPVLRTAGALQGPQEWFRAIAAAMAAAVGGDPGYTGTLTHNPAPAEPLLDWDLSTEWGPERPYTLGELAAGLTIPSGQPFAAAPDDPVVVGRNVSMFEAGMKWAGLRSNLDRPVLGYLSGWDAEHNSPRLPLSEVAGVARSIERIRSRWAARAATDPKGWHRPDWLARCQDNGRKGGHASGKARRAATAPRDARIAAMASQGLSRRQIAARTGLSVGGVCYVLNRPHQPTPDAATTGRTPPNTATHPRAAKQRELFPRNPTPPAADKREKAFCEMNNYATDEKRLGERENQVIDEHLSVLREQAGSPNRLAPLAKEKTGPPTTECARPQPPPATPRPPPGRT